ncbi:MAG: WecB/TagA/CpsF family glycosyltransferase [Candidatus Levybacteria bacterium]|nr:WecB/TagA/CpsF family glycosyltransferase [Candidatus Levybacteria bacterium]
MKIKDIIFNIKSLSFKETLEYIVEKAKKKDKKTFVTTINPEIIMLARGDLEYQKVLRSADLALADGIGVVWAGKMFGKSFKGRVHGSDLVEKVSETIAKHPITVGFLGGRENVAQQTAKRLTKKYPGLKVAFATQEANRLPHTDYGKTAVDRSRKAVSLKCDILFVALGSPKQEKWIYENLPKIPVRIAIGVGGAFDFISGKVARAPKWVRNLGLEWLFRLMIQPWRAKRQTALIKFVILVLKEKFLT